MPLTSSPNDYTDKDFDSIKLRMRNLIRSVFPEWTDFNVANFGNIMIELFAHTGDILGFYQDNQARQSRITTATQRKALLGLVKLIGFAPATATAATVDLTITLPAAAAGSATWPAGTFVRTEDAVDPVRYQLLEDAVIDAGDTSVTVSAENSESKEQLFASSALPNQSFVLGSTPYIDGSATIDAANGTYSQATNFLDSSTSDRHFTVLVDQNDRATIQFGNGINGAIPVGTITAGFKVGGGAAGRVEMAKLKVFEVSSWTDSLANPISPSVTNADPSSGGTDRQSVAQIKERGPASLRVLNRTVAREDFEINALRLTDVARALMITSNEDPTVAENTGQLYIVPVGGGAASEELLDEVLEQVTVTYPCTLTFDPSALTAVYNTIDITAKVFFRTGVNKTTAAALIRTNLATFFEPLNEDGTKNESVDFGANIKDSDGTVISELALSDIMNVVRDTTGVRKLGPDEADFTANGEHDDITLLLKEFPKLGEVIITDGDTGDIV